MPFNRQGHVLFVKVLVVFLGKLFVYYFWLGEIIYLFGQVESSTSICLLSNSLLFSTRYVNYFRVIWCISVMVFFIHFIGIMRSFNCLMLMVCISPLTPIVMMINNCTCHPCALIASMSGLYLPSIFLFGWLVQCITHG